MWYIAFGLIEKSSQIKENMKSALILTFVTPLD